MTSAVAVQLASLLGIVVLADRMALKCPIQHRSDGDGSQLRLAGFGVTNSAFSMWKESTAGDVAAGVVQVLLLPIAL